MLLARFLRRVIRLGRLTVIDAAGRTHRFGPGNTPSVTIRLHDPALHWKLFFRPELYAGEAYTNGTLTIEDASLYDFLDLMGRNFAAAGGDPLGGLHISSTFCSAACNRSIRCIGRGETSHTIMIYRVPSTTSSSTRIVSTVVLISSRRTTISTPRSGPNAGTLPPNCGSNRGCACSTSAAVGAASRCGWRSGWELRSPGSRCPKSN